MKIFTSQFKCINFLLIFYVVYNLLNCWVNYEYLLENLSITLLIITSALMSFTLILDDIISEVYGIKNAAKFYFSMVFARMAITTILYFFYKHFLITKYLFFITFYHPLAFTFAWYMNVSLLAKWKVLMHGKYFWLRSIGTSGIAVVIICLLSIPEDLKFTNWTLYQIFFSDFFFSSIFIIFFNTIFAFLGNFIVNILKIIEFSSTSKSVKSFNPFKQTPMIQ